MDFSMLSEGCAFLDDGLSHSSDVATLGILNLFTSKIWALYKQYMSTAWGRDEGPNRARQCPSMPVTARIANNHRSATASMKNPIQAPAIAPAVLEPQPKNHKLSSVVKWRYMSILPIDIDIPSAMLMSMPLSWARVQVNKRVAIRDSNAKKR